MKSIIYFLFSLIFFIGSNSIAAGASEAAGSAAVADPSRPILDLWFFAAKKGQMELLEQLIPRVNINAQDKNGLTALMYGAATGHKYLVDFLLQQADIDVNLQDNGGRTALMYAIMRSRDDIVEALLELPETGEVEEGTVAIDINLQNKNGNTALMLACTDNDPSLVKLLLKSPNILLNVKNDAGETALSSIYSGIFQMETEPRKNIIDLIKKKIAEFKATLKPVIFKAVEDSNIELIQALILKMGRSIFDIQDDDDNTPLHIVFARNNIRLAEMILKVSPNPQELLTMRNKKGQIALELVNPTSPIFLMCLDLAYPTSTKQETGLVFGSIWNAVSEWIWPKTTGGEKSPQVKLCGYCSKPDCTLRCASCKTIYYCSEKCQKEHWITHKQKCKTS